MRSVAQALLLSGLIVLPMAPAWSFDFDDLKVIERAEQDELIEKARQAANAWNFGSARSYLDQARQKGYASKQIKSVETLIAKNEAAKAEKDRREEEARQARLAAEEAERRRIESDRQRAASSAGGGYASSAYAQCSSSDTCFQFIRHERTSAIVRCTRGPSTGKEKCLSFNTKKYASGCSLTDTFAHHYTLAEAANLACQY